MRTKALYFPYINFPENEWLNLMLLYWDQLSSIVPSSYVYDHGKLSPHMRTLVNEGLATFIEPQKFIEDREEFGKPFIAFVSRRIGTRTIPIRKGVSQPFLVHIEKLGPVADELVSMNLATCTNYPWYEMDIWVANAFMSYLASFLGTLPEVNSTPLTNDEMCFHFLGGNPRRLRDRTIQRYDIIRNVLPFPKGELNLRKIIRFKEKHHEELARFRDRIEGLSIELSSIRDHKDREEKKERTIREFQQEIDYIAGHMGEMWHKIVFVDVFPVLAAGGLMITGIQTPEPITAALGGVSLSAAVYRSIERRRDRRELLHSHPLAYGALLKRGGLSLEHVKSGRERLSSA